MKSIRKALSAAVAVLLAVSMLVMSGCSTPEVAMTVDGREYSTGEYLANLYDNFYTGYYEGGLYQYVSYGMDPWTQTFSYGEGDAAQELVLADYIKQITQDSIVRQKAVKNLMVDYGITVPQEDLDTLYKDYESVKESEMLAMGFSKEHYLDMYVAVNLEASALFYGLYDEGGQKAVSATELRDYFEKNYVAFKAITLSQMDSEGNALSDAEKEANRKTLQGYLEQYNASGDMDAVIEQYTADTEAEDAESTTATTTTTAATTTTTEATTTTTAATTTTTAATTEEEEESETTTEEETEEETDPNLQILNSINGDVKIVEAIRDKVEIGSVSIIEYTTSDELTYIALVQRLDVEEEGGENYYEEQKETCLYGMKYDEFDAMLQAEVDTLEVVIDDRAISMCDPKAFIATE